jgi:hypothetical protein
MAAGNKPNQLGNLHRRTLLSALGLTVLGSVTGCLNRAGAISDGADETANTPSKQSTAMPPLEDAPDGFIRCRGASMTMTLSDTIPAEKVADENSTIQVTAGQRNGEPFTVDESVRLWLASKCTNAASEYLNAHIADRLGGQPYSSGIIEPASDVAVPLAISLYSPPPEVEPKDIPAEVAELTKTELVNQAPRTVQVTVPLSNGDQQNWPVPVYGREGAKAVPQ